MKIHLDRSTSGFLLIFRPDGGLVNVNSFLYYGHEYRTKGNATKVASTVHPDDINEKLNFLGSRYSSSSSFDVALTPHWNPFLITFLSNTPFTPKIRCIGYETMNL